MYRSIAILVLGLFVTPVHSMTFKIETHDIRPIDLAYRIYASGEIVTGDADNLLKSLRSAKV